MQIVSMYLCMLQCQWDKSEFTTRVSYPLPGKRKIPLEAILKTAFPIAGEPVIYTAFRSMFFYECPAAFRPSSVNPNNSD
jgi:hypothetical protein